MSVRRPNGSTFSREARENSFAFWKRVERASAAATLSGRFRLNAALAAEPET